MQLSRTRKTLAAHNPIDRWWGRHASYQRQSLALESGGAGEAVAQAMAMET
jgi:hypothetical protein